MQNVKVSKYRVELKLHKLEVQVAVPINTRLQVVFKIGTSRVESKNRFKFIHKESILFESLTQETMAYLHKDTLKLLQKKSCEIELFFINSNIYNKAGVIKFTLDPYLHTLD